MNLFDDLGLNNSILPGSLFNDYIGKIKLYILVSTFDFPKPKPGLVIKNTDVNNFNGISFIDESQLINNIITKHYIEYFHLVIIPDDAMVFVGNVWESNKLIICEKKEIKDMKKSENNR